MSKMGKFKNEGPVSQLSATMMSWVGCLLTDSSATRYMKIKRRGILRRFWLFSANKNKL